jgi:hypothetical protein
VVAEAGPLERSCAGLREWQRDIGQQRHDSIVDWEG